jgi:hypothetical protein
MSRSTAEQVMLRVSSAIPESPIAVFQAGDAFNAVFASTIKSKEQIDRGTNLVGVFHNKMDAKEIKKLLGAEA